jgi:benzoyl-CoA reductase subunit BamB
MRRKDEKPPADHWKKRFPELETKLLDDYYAYKGWNSQGIPTEESLRDLSLDYVADEFLERGILTAGGEPPAHATTANETGQGE